MRYLTAFALALLAVVAVPSVNFSQVDSDGEFQGSRGRWDFCARLDREDRCQRGGRGIDAQ